MILYFSYYIKFEWINISFLTEIFDFNKKILATAQMNTIYFEKMQLYPSNQSTCMQNMYLFYWEKVRLLSKFSTFETDFKWQPFSNKPWVYHIFRFLFEFRPTPQGMISFQKRMASLLDSLNLFNFFAFLASLKIFDSPFSWCIFFNLGSLDCLFNITFVPLRLYSPEWLTFFLKYS